MFVTEAGRQAREQVVEGRAEARELVTRAGIGEAVVEVVDTPGSGFGGHSVDWPQCGGDCQAPSSERACCNQETKHDRRSQCALCGRLIGRKRRAHDHRTDFAIVRLDRV